MRPHPIFIYLIRLDLLGKTKTILKDEKSKVAVAEARANGGRSRSNCETDHVILRSVSIPRQQVTVVLFSPSVNI